MLLDYIDIVVHVQHADERTYYSLERLWKDCPVLALPASVTSGRSIGPGPTPGAFSSATHTSTVNGHPAAHPDDDTDPNVDTEDDAAAPTPDSGGEA